LVNEGTVRLPEFSSPTEEKGEKGALRIGGGGTPLGDRGKPLLIGRNGPGKSWGDRELNSRATGCGGGGCTEHMEKGCNEQTKERGGGVTTKKER